MFGIMTIAWLKISPGRVPVFVSSVPVVSCSHSCSFPEILHHPVAEDPLFVSNPMRIYDYNTLYPHLEVSVQLFGGTPKVIQWTMT